ncbi:histone-lysine N-methyltransferase SETDB1-B-like isoform X3 [Dysidea avara]
MKDELQKIRELHRISDRVVHRNGQTTSLTEHSSSSVRPHRKKEEANKKEHVNETESHQHRAAEVTHEQRGHDSGSNEAAVDLAEMDVLSNGDVEEPFEERETVEEGINVLEKDSEQERQTQTKDSSKGRGIRKEQQELEEEDSDWFSQSTSHSSSPMLEKSKRVSVHREFDADYQPPTALDTNNQWQLTLGQHILVRSTKDNQWYPGVILDISYRNYLPYRYQVLSEGKRSRVKGSNLALIENCAEGQSIAVGARVVGVYGALEVLYAGVVAEIPCKENKHRVLVFYDDGFAQYTTLDRVHLVCESGCNIWEEVAKHSREFIQRYLDSYPIRPMVRLKISEELFVEWRGKWMKAVVTQIDCSLVRVLFSETRMHEWLYRGSTRLEPIFIALTPKKGQNVSIPTKKSRQYVECSSNKEKKFLIVYDHFDMYSLNSIPVVSPEIDDNTGLMPSDSNASGSNNGAAAANDKNVPSMSSQTQQTVTCSETTESLVTRATPLVSDINIDKVTTVSTTWTNSDGSDTETLAQADHRDLQPGTRTEVSPLMKMALSKQRALIRAAPDNEGSPASKRACQDSQSSVTTEFHAGCTPSCVPHNSVRFNGVFNPLAFPLLNGWNRQTMEVNPNVSKATHVRSHIYYTTPCGRRLRSIAEVDRYLAMADITYLSIDQFCFSPSISINMEPYSCPTDTKYYMKDISDGKEKKPVSCVNELQNQAPPSFHYSTDRMCGDDVIINTEASFLIGCQCTDGCRDPTKCACARLTIEEGTCMVSRTRTTPGYTYRRLEREQQSAVYECNSNCQCGSTCANRLVQLGLQLRLQVFRTQNKGWGIRCLDDIPKGTFVCTYSGDIHTDAGANKKGSRQGDEYLAELDYIEVMERHKEGYESEMEVSSVDYLSDEFTMQSSSSDDEMSDYNDTQLDSCDQKTKSRKSSTSTPSVNQSNDTSLADVIDNRRDLKKSGLKLHKLKATPPSESTTPSLSHGSTKSKASPLAEIVVCDSSSSSDEQLPCYFPLYSLKPNYDRSSSCSPISVADDSRKESVCDEDERQHLSVEPANTTTSSSILLHSIRRKLFDEGQCYVMDAKLQGNIGRYLNHSCQPNLFVQNVFVDTHDLRFPWVAFFTNQNVKAMTELTWDYNYEVGSVPDKELPCYCGAANCRKRLL